MRWRRYARRAVSALFVIVAVWLFLSGEHLWSLAATGAGIVLVAWMEMRETRHPKGCDRSAG